MTNTCFPVLNLTFFTNVQAQINGAQSAEELQALVNDVYEQLSYMYSTFESQLSFLGPIEALLTPPTTDPSKIVTWITDFITGFLTPYVTSFATLTAQITALTAQVAILSALIAEVASTKFPGVTITIPTVGSICSL